METQDSGFESIRAMRLAAWLTAVFVILVWGVTFANTRSLLMDFSPLEIQVIRFAAAWLLLVVVGLVCKRKDGCVRTTWCDEVLFAAMGLTGVAVYQLLENCAIYYTNASNVAILVSFGPIVTAVLTRLLLKDNSLSMPLVVGSIVSVCGVALVAHNGCLNFDLRPLGDIMALCAMASWGFYSVLVAKANKRGIPQITVIRKSFFWALVLMSPLLVWGATESGYYALDGSFSIELDVSANVARFARPLNWLNLGFLGVLASAVCFVLWSRACKSLGVVRTTIGLYFTPIVGVIFAVLFLGERLTAMSMAGGGLIIAGVAITHIKRRL